MIDNLFEFAKQKIREGPRIQPTVIGTSAGSKTINYLLSFGSDKEKSNALRSVRIYFTADEVQKYYVVMESWVRFAEITEDVDGKVSEHPDRKDAIMVLYCERTPEGISRDMRCAIAKGRNFIDLDSKAMSYLGGDFSNLLAPEWPPTQEVLEMMKLLLASPQWPIFSKGVERIEN